jgi:hypothetical protein
VRVGDPVGRVQGVRVRDEHRHADGEGWGQIRIPPIEVVEKSFDLGKTTRLMSEVLTEETDPYFLWQFDPEYECPVGCGRVKGSCKVV